MLEYLDEILTYPILLAFFACIWFVGWTIKLIADNRLPFTCSICGAKTDALCGCYKCIPNQPRLR